MSPPGRPKGEYRSAQHEGPPASEWDRMVAGHGYDPQDPELVAARDRARRLCHQLNTCPPNADRMRRLLAELFAAETDVYVTPPFFCDYGVNVRLGNKVYFNFNCVILDVAPVTVGSNVLFGPNAQVYTALHPLDAGERRRGVESAQPVTMEDDVWIGGGAIVCPGVRIGARSVIGAGSVVTRDVPPDVFAAGNPCRVIRPIPPEPLRT
jgi:maltose O-acetyltransferase